MRRIAIPVLIAVLTAGACWPFSEGGELSPMTLKRTSKEGRIEVTRGNDTFSVRDETPIEPGDVVKTDGAATGLLRLEGERRIAIDVLSQTRIVGEDSVDSQRGSLLVKAEESVMVRFGEAEASATDADFRIDRGYASTRAGTYSGSIALSAPGQTTRDVGTLFQSTVVANNIQERRPYRLDPRDEWDVTQLGDIVALDQELDRLSGALTSSLGKSRPGLRYFTELAGDNVGFMKPFLSRRPADLLIGFTIAENAPDHSLRKGFLDAFELFDDGAVWGVAAGIMDVKPRPLVADLDEVILGTGIVAGGTGDTAEFSVAAASESDIGSDSGSTSGPVPPIATGGSTDTADTDGAGPSDGDGDEKEPKTEPEPDDCGNDVECALQDNGVTPPPPPQPTPSPSL